MKMRIPPRRKPVQRPMKVRLKAVAARSAKAEEYYDDEEEEYDDDPNMKLSHAFLIVLVLHLLAVGGVFGFNALKGRQGNTAKAETTATAPAVTETAAVAQPAANQPEAATSAAASAETAKPELNSHTVVPGDSLFKVAATYGVSVEGIQAVNELGDSTVIRVGQVILIPEAGSTPAAQTAAAPVPAKAPASAAPAPSKPAPAPAVAKKAETPAPAAPVAATGNSEFYVVEKGENPYSIAKKLKVDYRELLAVNKIEDPTKIQIGQKLKVPVSP